MIQTDFSFLSRFFFSGDQGFTKIVGNLKNFWIGKYVIIDDFVFIMIGDKTVIGDHVHISSFTSMTGGGSTHIGDFATISSGCRIFAGTDVVDGSGLVNSTIPGDFRSVHRGKIVLEPHSFVGANSVLLPDVVLGRGSVIGAGSFVPQGMVIPEWEIWAGSPVKFIKRRPQEKILELENELRRRQ
jgi:galactoside O-acetyltransferase